MLVVFLFIIIIQLSEYNYQNIINYLINILILFCFYSIVLDNLFNILKYRLRTILFELSNVLQKLFLSYITISLIAFKVRISLENKITAILFKEKMFKKKDDFTDSLIFFYQIMLKIKEKNDAISNNVIIIIIYLLYLEKLETKTIFFTFISFKQY
jgi:hypothetical protein